MPINSQNGDSVAHNLNDAPANGAQQSVAMLRGAPVEVNTQRVIQFVVGLVVLTLAILSVTFFVSGVHQNSNVSNLQHHGVPVSVTVLGCTGELGGSGSNVANFICEGTFRLNGRNYRETVPGQSFRASGTTLTLITTKNNPSLLATRNQVNNERSSWTVFIVPFLLFAALIAFAWLFARRRLRRATNVPREGVPLTEQSQVSSPPVRVGFAGLGTMGAFMAANLVRAGFSVTVWNRTPGRATDLLKIGAREATSPSELAQECDIVITCLTDTPQVNEVLFGERGINEGLAPGSLFIDCSTISPLSAQEIAGRLMALGVTMLDAPVSGGSEGARLGTLSIMVGGEDKDFERARPMLNAMGSTITHLGAVGSGQWAKAINQVVLAGTYLGVAEGVTLGLKAGLDVERVVGAIQGGAAASWVLTNRSDNMINDDYPLGFKIALHRKDLGIGLTLAETVGAVLPITAMAAAFEDDLEAQGHGDDDISALARPIRRLSGLD